MRFALAVLLFSVTLSADTLITIDYPGATSTDLTGTRRVMRAILATYHGRHSRHGSV